MSSRAVDAFSLDCVNGMGFANWAKALAMFINCHGLKPLAIDAETHWASAQMEVS
jgi:hypothetical protein